MDYSNLYRSCTLCSRSCGIDRTAGEVGFCKSTAIPRVSRAALHFWEEPIISGTRGSGTIFFSGCSLGCVFCQNRKISRAAVGRKVSDRELADIMHGLMHDGAHNINFVTPTHFAPSVVNAVKIARGEGMNLPIVYNTGSYDTRDTIRLMSGTADVYLPDFKYYRNETAKKLSLATDYPQIAEAAISEMVRQHPEPVIKDGIMQSGVVVRILLLPGHLAEAKLTVRYLYDTYGDNIYLSLMNQYTPMAGMLPPLDRKVTNAEYDELCTYAERIGVVNAFVQEGATQSESFIPDFEV